MFATNVYWPRIVGLILVNFIFCSSVYAAHLIGGEITYRCLGNGNYTFTMKIYRDCRGSGAQFDSAPGGFLVGTVSIYEGNSLLRNIDLSAPTITRLEPELSPCFVVPRNVCVEEGVYTWTTNLPPSTEDYHISYQRCCRNETINNLLDPDGQGATYTVTVRANAQSECNNSPTFNNIPPIVICGNEQLDVDQSAQNNDPDTYLRYALCEPYNGGGRLDTEPGLFSFNGIAPNPDAPPPYASSNFRQPNFSFSYPMPAAPAISIDSVTGRITGFPNANGQYVVAICVKEFKLGGELINEVRREFQFNVTDCERKVFSSIEADSSISDTYFLTSCGDRSINIVNNSRDPQFIESYLWKFEEGGVEMTETTKDFSHTFQDTGRYIIYMYLNEGIQDENCKDSAVIDLRIGGKVEADFDFSYDTCVDSGVQFEDLSSSEYSKIERYEWDFDDGGQAFIANPQHGYSEGGRYDVELWVKDAQGCSDRIIKNVAYFPVPQLIVLAPVVDLSCAPVEFVLDLDNELITSEYEVTWFIDGIEVAKGLNQTVVFEEPGVHDLSVEILSPFGCELMEEWKGQIEVLQPPIADFSFFPTALNQLESTTRFNNLSQFADGYLWTIGDYSSTEENPIYHFPDTGMFTIQLVATKNNGCTDTAWAVADVTPLNTFFLPNAFTPNTDGYSDVYRGQGIFLGMKNFHMRIWDRWGEEVFTSEDPNLGWDGTNPSNGEACPQGVYFCRVEYYNARGEFRSIEEKISLLR